MHILLIFRCNYQLPPLSETFVPTANWLYWIDEIMSHVLSILSNTVVFCNVIIFTIHVIWFDKMSMVNTISHLEFMYYLNLWSSLIYNKSARHKRHECDISNTSATRVLHKRHEGNTSATRTTRVRHEWKIFDFDNDTVKNLFSHRYIYYMTSEKLQVEEQFHSEN